MKLSDYMPVVIRYAITWIFAFLAARGFLGEEQNAILSQNIDTIVAAIISIIPIGVALWNRPSKKARTVAKIVDADLPKSAPVVIQTPAGEENIVVHSKTK